MKRYQYQQRFLWSLVTALQVCCATSTALADGVVPSNVPLANIDVAPSNVVLALSVEFPTADTASYGVAGYSPTYNSTQTYYGYFDPAKCYLYSSTNRYFSPATCTASTPKGNFLNWVSMTNLDQFRQSMTGGNRWIDTPSLTVLQRAFTDALGGGVTETTVVSSNINAPNRVATTADAGNMGSSSTQYIYKISGLGDKILVQQGSTITLLGTSASNLAAMAVQDCPTLVTTYKSAHSNNNPPWTCYHIRVKVCDSASGLEANCVQYGSNYKPEGLMQKYSFNMRFAAVGYLTDNSKTNTQQGGVLRARMESIGPVTPDPLNVSADNPAKEWSSATGQFFQNPDAADATASSTLSGTTISNSGIINYLNRFGYSPSTSTGYAYKYYDPMAELYYDAVRYLRGMRYSNQSVAYATSSNATRFDGFPVIKFAGAPAVSGAANSNDDPITSACQPNFIITLGDVNNSCDQRIYNAPIGTEAASSGGCSGGSYPTPSDPVNFAPPTSTVTAWDPLDITLSHGNTPLIAGMAYWSHINDIRPDKAAGRMPGQIQNITTYTVDVMEKTGGSSYTGTKKTQFWLAAKYGGFDLTKTDQTSTTTRNNPNTNNGHGSAWDANGDGIPDNWFRGNDPIAIQTGLASVFDKITAAGSIGDGAAPATSGVTLATASEIYYATYSLANGGRGSVKACAFSSTDCGNNTDWDAANWLTPGVTETYTDLSTGTTGNAYTYLDSDTREIITRSGGTGVPFLYGSLAAADQGSLSYDPQTQVADTVTSPTRAEKRVNFLRGDAANEIVNGGVFRSRSGTRLGDIVDAGPVYVGAPNALYSGDLFPGYSDFISDNLNRKPVLYAGANDGMLHGFDVSNGKELFAYVPGYFLQTDAGKNAARIASLTNPLYSHNFFVDATPMVGDVEIGGTWKTLLVGGYGAGGQGFYALDITNPTALSEAQAATVSKWEIASSDSTGDDALADIGYTYNQPTISPISGQFLQFGLVPTGESTHRWAIIVGNGFGSATGKAALLFIDPATGGIFNEIVVDSSIARNGLATPFPVDTDQDGLIDTIWAGDLNGTMWRVRWDMTACNTDASQCQWVTTALFRAGATQPITSAPAVAPHCVSGYNVVFGTGKYIERPDYNTTTQQSLYGIHDDLSGSDMTEAKVAKTDLVQQTIASTSAASTSNGDITRSYSSNTVNYLINMGWYIDLPASAGERSITNPVILADTGIALLGSFVPATACLPITGYVNVLNACTGGQAYDPSGTAIAGIGGLGAGIPYLSTPISDRSQSVILINPAARPGFTLPPTFKKEIIKGFNSGVRASWRQLR